MLRHRIIKSWCEAYTDPNQSSPTAGSYTITLNDQWRKSSTISNPDSTKYNGVYESYSNYNVNSGVAIMYIDITGYSDFKLYIRSYAESNYDYVMVSQLDKTITGSSSSSDTTLVKAHTKGNQQSGTAIGSYTLVTFNNIDGGSHRITILYRKDSVDNKNDDRGYLLIEGGNSYSDSGDVNIDTTYSIMYTSSDLEIVTPYDTSAFGANITGNYYIEGQGILTFDAPVTSIGKNAFRDCSSLTSVTIPDSVTSIGGYAFYGCSSLTSVTIPDSVTEIGYYAFQGCTSLTSVTISDNVNAIGQSAFYGCRSLTSVTISDNVNAIGQSAFYGCRSLTSVYCKPTTPPTGGSYMFNANASGRKIYVPAASVGAYKAASGWSGYANYIVGYDFSDDGSGGNDGSGELITFTIDETEYQAEEGMTWGEWVASDYNVNGDFVIDPADDSIGYGDNATGFFLSYVGGVYDYVHVSDIIQEGYNYPLVE